MRAYLFAGTSGWVGTILMGTVALLPYLLRRSILTGRRGIVLPSGPAYLQRMWPHYWLAYGTTALSFGHAWTLMSRGGVPRTSSLGLYLATLALLLLLVQMVMGLALQQRNLPERRSLRRWHYRTMAAVIVLVGSHIWLNG
jgi:hypothetical protein